MRLLALALLASAVSATIAHTDPEAAPAPKPAPAPVPETGQQPAPAAVPADAPAVPPVVNPAGQAPAPATLANGGGAAPPAASDLPAEEGQGLNGGMSTNDGTPETFFSYTSPATMKSRLDPIISPGKVSGHVHIFMGTSRVAANLDSEAAMAGTCTSAELSVDKSAYWAPALYYKSKKDNKFYIVPHEGVITYWLYRHFLPGEITPDLPPNLRIVSGNPMRTSYNESNWAEKRVNFQCWKGGEYDLLTPWIPADHECENLRANIEFPNCWDGKTLYDPAGKHVVHNHGDHACPKGYKRIPTLLMEINYKPALMPNYEWYPGCFVFAHGDTHGYTSHADWLNGFPAGFFPTVQQECKGQRGQLTCPYLQKWAKMDPQCPPDAGSHIVDEQIGIEVGIDKLPGDNPVFNCTQSSKPKTPGYKEAAQIVSLGPQTGGGCLGMKCSEYMGGGVPATDTAPKGGFEESAGQGGAITSDGHLAVNGEGIDQKSGGGSVSPGQGQAMGTGQAQGQGQQSQQAQGQGSGQIPPGGAGTGSPAGPSNEGGVGSGNGEMQDPNGVPVSPMPHVPASPAQGVQPASTVQVSPVPAVPQNPTMQSSQSGVMSAGSGFGGVGNSSVAENSKIQVEPGSDSTVDTSAAPGGFAGQQGMSTSPTPNVNAQMPAAGNGATTVTMTVTMTVTAPCEASTAGGGSEVGAGSAVEGGGGAGAGGGSGVQANEKTRVEVPNNDTTGVRNTSFDHESGSSGKVGAARPTTDRHEYGVPDAMVGGKLLNLVKDHKIRAMHKGKRSW